MYFTFCWLFAVAGFAMLGNASYQRSPGTGKWRLSCTALNERLILTTSLVAQFDVFQQLH